MTRPTDAAAFVEYVQRATNEYVTDAVYDIFADDARSMMITDGARDEFVGVDAIHVGWARSCAAFRARRFRLEKRLVAATDDIIVNEWTGGPDGRRDGCGIEIWRFNRDGKVVDQRLYSYLNVRPTWHPIQVLQLMLASPAMALTAGWARLRQRWGDVLLMRNRGINSRAWNHGAS